MYSGITQSTFTFAQLIEANKGNNPLAEPVSNKAVELARKTLQEYATYDEWYDCTVEMWEEALDQIGFTNAKIAFSGFWSQGDGASFTAEVNTETILRFLTSGIKPTNCITCDDSGNEDFRGWIVDKVNELPSVNHNRVDWILSSKDYLGSLDWKIRRNGLPYVHDRSCQIESNHDYAIDSGFDTIANILEESIDSLRLDLCRAIYKMLEAEYDYLRSDENLSENGYEFRFDNQGKRVDY